MRARSLATLLGYVVLSVAAAYLLRREAVASCVALPLLFVCYLVADSEIQWQRVPAVGLGVLLVAIPTVYTLFSPELLSQTAAGERGIKSLGVRAAVGIVWGVLVAYAVYHQVRRDRMVDTAIEESSLSRETSRRLAADEVLRTMLVPGTSGSPPDFEWSVYAVDKSTGHLMPIFPLIAPGQLALRTFRTGQGATGLAFARRGVVVVRGDAVSNADFGLSPAQQAGFACYRSVAAAPLVSDGRAFGVLSAISRTDESYFDSAAGRAVLQRLAETVAQVLTSMAGIGAPGA